MIRHLVQAELDIHVVYANEMSLHGYHDEGFNRQITWDIPLLGGYSHTSLNQQAPAGSYLQKIRIYRRQFRAWLANHPADVIWIHGWGDPWNIAAWLEARQHNIPTMLRGDTHLGCLLGSPLRRRIHRFLLSKVFQTISRFLAVGTANADLYRCYGVADSKIFLVPYAVDNDFFRERCLAAHQKRVEFRQQWQIPPDACVFLYASKIIPNKDPATLVQAFIQLAGDQNQSRPVLLMVGDGSEREAMETLAAAHPQALIRFTGFCNQTELPVFFDLCDAFVLPSTFEPWGLVVNEVMNAAKPLILSDRVGAAPDLIKDDVNGLIFPAGDVAHLTHALQRVATHFGWRQSAGSASLSRIRRWSFNEDLEGIVHATKIFKGINKAT